MMKTLIATTLLATSAHATSVCTFENLPAPTFEEVNSPQTGFYQDPLGSYEGFNFTSSYAQSNNSIYAIFNNKWSYYDMVGGPGWGGYDEGIIGDRAIYTPWGSYSDYNYRIGRNELWRLNSLEITSVWNNMTVVIEGYRYGVGVFTYTAQLSTAQRVKLLISQAYPGPVNNITEIKVYGAGVGTHLAIDNIDYTVVPAPSALALIGIAGLMGVRRRR
jgi:hypothetical protein